MKKLLLMGVIATAAITTASAQVSFGPRVGVNFANMSSVQDIDIDEDGAEVVNVNTKSKTGLLLGVVANFGMNDLISIQPELLYSQQGYKVTEGEYKSTTSMNYLQLPILVKASFGDGDTKFHANIGPQFGYWMSGKEKEEGPDGKNERDFKFEDDAAGNGANRLAVGLLAGVGVGRQVGAGMMTLDLRYDLGLSDVHKYASDRPSNIDKASNRVLSLSLSYMFGGE